MSGSIAEIKWNPEALNALKKLLSDAVTVKVGVLSDGQLHTGDSLGAAGLAAVHEFGASLPRPLSAAVGKKKKGSPDYRIPERSFLRLTAFEKQNEYKSWANQNAAKIFEAIMAGRLESEVMPKIGALWVGYVQDCFRSRGFGTWKPLKPETIRRKGSSAPLIDTGALLRSITFEVTNE